MAVNRFGRRPLNIPVTKVCDALQLCQSVTKAANELKCSRAYIYKILKASSLRPEEAIKKYAKDNTRGKQEGGG